MINLEELVSPETIMKFTTYKNILAEWNHKTLLVQIDTLNDFTIRHVVDSLQIIPLILNRESQNNDTKRQDIDSYNHFPYSLSLFADQKNPLEDAIKKQSTVSILDIGTGAGFPGMALAMCGFANVTLCESNLKKCIFLEEVARKTDTPVTIINERAEKLKNEYDVIVSRACGSLELLCTLMNKASRDNSSIGIFHKGITWQNEIKDAALKWDFDLEVHKSMTNEKSVVLVVQKLQKQDTP
jgi:16S rRNA (guanine527-N7)-methyltransferase